MQLDLLEGLEQGNGASLKGFLTIDNALGKAYITITKAGINISNPDGTKIIRLVKISFVDDMKLLFELPETLSTQIS